MNLFGSFLNLMTGNRESLEEEKKAYDNVEQYFENMNHILDNVVKSDSIIDLDCLEEQEKNDLLDAKNKILILNASLKNTVDRKKIILELQKARIAYEKLQNEIKEKLLKRQNLESLKKEMTQLKACILKNASYEAFDGFVNEDSWDMQKLELLRNQIANRRVKMIQEMNIYRKK